VPSFGIEPGVILYPHGAPTHEVDPNAKWRASTPPGHEGERRSLRTGVKRRFCSPAREGRYPDSASTRFPRRFGLERQKRPSQRPDFRSVRGDSPRMTWPAKIPATVGEERPPHPAHLPPKPGAEPVGNMHQAFADEVAVRLKLVVSLHELSSTYQSTCRSSASAMSQQPHRTQQHGPAGRACPPGSSPRTS